MEKDRFSLVEIGKTVDKLKQNNTELLKQNESLVECLKKCVAELENSKEAIWELMEYQDGWECNKDRIEEKICKANELLNTLNK